MTASVQKAGKLKRRVLTFAALVIVLFLAAGVYLGHANRASAIKATLEWSRLAPFPVPDQQLTVQTEGSTFTRAFRVQFVAAPEAIDEWLGKSLGVSNPKPDRTAGHIRHYDLVPGGGAQHAEVEVDDDTHTVRVYVCWS